MNTTEPINPEDITVQEIASVMKSSYKDVIDMTGDWEPLATYVHIMMRRAYEQGFADGCYEEHSTMCPYPDDN